MMKAGDGRYAGNKLWGDGWGWSWFDAGQPVKDDVDQLQDRLPVLPRAGASFRLDLRQWIPAAEAIAATEW